MNNKSTKSISLPELPRNTEVGIIGAGIMGLFTGLYLARAGKEVVIVDRGEFWHEASAVNSGGIAVQNKRLPLVPFAMEAIRIWQNLREELKRDVEYVRCGGLRIATSAEEVDRLRISAAKQKDYGVEIEWLEGDQLRDWAPWLGPGVCAATFCSVEGFASPLLIGSALKEALSKAGGRVVARAMVHSLTRETGGFRVGTTAGSFVCRTLVIAAGAWSGEITRLLNIHLPIHLDVDVVTVTEPYKPVMDRLVTHIRGVLSLRQLPNGTCIIGGGWQGRGDLFSGRKDVDYENLLHNLRFAFDVVPGLENVNIVRSWAGFEGVTPDSLPVFGRLPGYEDVFITSCARGGYTVGPALGRLMAELILTGETSLPVSEFDPRRFLQ